MDDGRLRQQYPMTVSETVSDDGHPSSIGHQPTATDVSLSNSFNTIIRLDVKNLFMGHYFSLT